LTLSSSDLPGVDLFPGDKLTDLEYADDIVLLSEDADKMQDFLTTLNMNVS
ncbi:polyprotein, partial [Schistosoma japonicum]